MAYFQNFEDPISGPGMACRCILSEERDWIDDWQVWIEGSALPNSDFDDCRRDRVFTAPDGKDYVWKLSMTSCKVCFWKFEGP